MTSEFTLDSLLKVDQNQNIFPMILTFLFCRKNIFTKTPWSGDLLEIK